MPFSFLPRMIYPHLTDVRAEDLIARGVSFLMLDFDNTIVPYTTDTPSPPTRRANRRRKWPRGWEPCRPPGSAFASCQTAESRAL